MRNVCRRLKLAGQARLDDFFQVSGLGPRFQPANDHRVIGQVEKRTRAPGRDHLAATDLAWACLLMTALLRSPRVSRA